MSEKTSSKDKDVGNKAYPKEKRCRCTTAARRRREASRAQARVQALEQERARVRGPRENEQPSTGSRPNRRDRQRIASAHALKIQKNSRQSTALLTIEHFDGAMTSCDEKKPKQFSPCIRAPVVSE